MANSWIEPPPPQRGMGCFGKGCLILAVFIFVLLVACCVGFYWGLRHHSAFMRGFYWANKTHMLANSPKEIPAHEAPEAEIQSVRERLDNFENTVDRHEPAAIELTADDINDLISTKRHLRGKVFVSIEGDRFRIQTSVPLQAYARQKGYYLNADATIQLDGEQSLEQPRLSAIVINGEAVPKDLLDWKYDSRPLRHYLTEFQQSSNVGTIEIRDGKVILKSQSR
jgi:hypothetical protein